MLMINKKIFNFDKHIIFLEHLNKRKSKTHQCPTYVPTETAKTKPTSEDNTEGQHWPCENVYY